MSDDNKRKQKNSMSKYDLIVTDAIKKIPLDKRFQAIAMNNIITQKKNLDTQVDELLTDASLTYYKQITPITQRLNKIIAGEIMPSEEELREAFFYLSTEEMTNVPLCLNSNPVSEYWYKVLINCEKISQEIFPADHLLLKHLLKIESIHSEDDSDSFTIKFTFSQNIYINNEFIYVKFYMLNEREPKCTESGAIFWKGDTFLNEVLQSKPKSKKGLDSLKNTEIESFFNFFKSLDPSKPGSEDEEEILERLNLNYDIAVTIKEELMNYHLEYFLGLREDVDDANDFISREESTYLESRSSIMMSNRTIIPEANKTSQCNQQ